MAMLQIPFLTALPGHWSLVCVASAGIGLVYWIACLVLGATYPPNVPLVAEPEGTKRFSIRTRLAYYINCRALYHEANTKYLKHGIPVVVPSSLFHVEILLPPGLMRWAFDQPDHVLSSGHANVIASQLHWSFGDSRTFLDPWQSLIIKADLNRALENVCSVLNQELGLALDESWGTDEDNWRRVDLLPVMRTVIARAATRFQLGLPICRDAEYISTAINIVEGSVINSGLIRATPTPFRPLVGALLAIPMSIRRRKLARWIVPLWKQRLDTLKYDRREPGHMEPTDQLQMMIRYAHKERPQELHDYNLIMSRMVSSIFGALHQTSLQATNLLVNMLGSDAEFNTIATLKEEMDRVLGPDDDNTRWTKAQVSQLVRTDSAARESVQRYAFAGHTVLRRVMVDGLTTPDGHHLPKGSSLSFLSRETYSDPTGVGKYDPFRFSRIREAAQAQGGQGDQGDQGDQKQKQKPTPVTFVSTSPDYLPFAHGTHVCPGRFLVDFELKMLLAYVLRHYDIKFPDEYNGQRPPNRWLAEALCPPIDVKVMVKRRPGKK